MCVTGAVLLDAQKLSSRNVEFLCYWISLKVHMDFSIKSKTDFSFSPIIVWIWYFECVDYIPHGITLIVLSECLDLIVINFNWPTQSWTIVQQEISSMIFANHFGHIQ